MGIKNLFFGTAVVVASAAVASITTYKVIERNNIVEIPET